MYYIDSDYETVLFTQNGLHKISNEGESACSYFQTVLHQLNASEKLDWTTYYGSPPPDIGNNFWDTTSVQDRGIQFA